MVVLIAAALWCAASVPAALIVGRLLHGAPPELVGVDGRDLLYRRPDGTLARVAWAPAVVAR